MWRVSIQDAAQANEIFNMLMGIEVAPRKRFIETHAHDADIDS